MLDVLTWIPEGFSGTQGDLFVRARHATLALDILWCTFNQCKYLKKHPKLTLKKQP